jgi:hypothetical protein
MLYQFLVNIVLAGKGTNVNVEGELMLFHIPAFKSPVETPLI